MSPTLTAAAAAGPGRTRITSRALARVASAVTAEELNVESKKVSVDFEDEGGALTLTVRSPIHVVSLDRVIHDKSVVARTGGSVMDRAAKAQEDIRTRIQSLTGSNIGRVVLQLTAADIKQEKRVK